MSLARALLVVLACATTPVFAGSSNHGGEGVRILFAKARYTAASMVRAYVPVDGVTAANADQWLSLNKEALADDILASQHVWVDTDLSHEAMTALDAGAPIQLSLPMLRAAYYTHDRAAELLIHESVHHLGEADETLADAVAIAVGRAHAYRQPPRALEARIVPFAAPSGLQAGHANVAAATNVGDEVFFWAPRPSGSRGYLFDPISRAWREAAADGQPSRRIEALHVEADGQVLVWGGTWESDSFGDGARYDVKENKWTPMSTVGAPSPRFGAVGVWTGKELVVWGGRSKFAVYSDGAIYDPATDKWRTIKLAGAPQSATFAGMTGVWADGRVVLHGYGRYRAWLYDPAANKWESSSSPDDDAGFMGPPQEIVGRDAAVWTGTHVFWMGWRRHPTLSPKASPFAALFDPKTKKWTHLPLDTRHAPLAGETSYTAFRAGGRILLFGANGDGFPMHSFDLTTKEWRIIGFDDRQLPIGGGTAAVWTGESIVSLGGLAGTETLFGAMVEP